MPANLFKPFRNKYTVELDYSVPYTVDCLFTIKYSRRLLVQSTAYD